MEHIKKRDVKRGGGNHAAHIEQHVSPKRLARRAFSMFMAIVMLMSMVFFSAFAEGESAAGSLLPAEEPLTTVSEEAAGTPEETPEATGGASTEIETPTEAASSSEAASGSAASSGEAASESAPSEDGELAAASDEAAPGVVEQSEELESVSENAKNYDPYTAGDATLDAVSIDLTAGDKHLTNTGVAYDVGTNITLKTANVEATVKYTITIPQNTTNGTRLSFDSTANAWLTNPSVSADGSNLVLTGTKKFDSSVQSINNIIVKNENGIGNETYTVSVSAVIENDTAAAKTADTTTTLVAEDPFDIKIERVGGDYIAVGYYNPTTKQFSTQPFSGGILGRVFALESKVRYTQEPAGLATGSEPIDPTKPVSWEMELSATSGGNAVAAGQEPLIIGSMPSGAKLTNKEFNGFYNNTDMTLGGNVATETMVKMNTYGNSLPNVGTFTGEALSSANGMKTTVVGGGTKTNDVRGYSTVTYVFTPRADGDTSDYRLVAEVKNLNGTGYSGATFTDSKLTNNTYDTAVQAIEQSKSERKQSINFADGMGGMTKSPMIYSCKISVSASLQNSDLFGVKAINQLIKLENGVTFTGAGPDSDCQPMAGTGSSVKFLYACKPNGQAWTETGGDHGQAEILTTTMDDLVYFDTLAAAQAHGAVVGYLIENRGTRLTDNNIRSTGKVDVSGDAGDVVVAFLDTWWWESTDAAPASAAGTNGAAVTFANPSATTGASEAGMTFQRAVYNADGTRTTDPNNRESAIGSSVLLTGYKGQATNMLLLNGSNPNNNASTYDIADGQRVAAFSIDYELKYTGTEGTDPHSDTVTKMRSLVLTEPKGTLINLFVAPETADITWNDSTQSFAGTGLTKIEDMSQLKLKGGYKYKIYGSFMIGDPTDVSKDPTSGTKQISADFCAADTVVDFGSWNTSAVVAKPTIIKSQKIAVSKMTNKPVINANGNAEFGVSFNALATTLEKYALVDILPYKGDSRGSDFTGDYTFGNISMDISTTEASVVSSLKVYYTTDTAVRTATVAADIGTFNASNFLGVSWTELNPTAGSGSATHSVNTYTGAGSAKPTAIIVVGTLSKNDQVYLDYELKTSGSVSADTFINTATGSYQGNTSLITSNKSQVSVIGRTIQGYIWNDANSNGAQDSGETAASNVKVTLYNKGGTKLADTTTDTNGKYLFKNPTESTAGYYVTMQLLSTDDENVLATTYKAPGVADDKDSDFIATAHPDSGNAKLNTFFSDVFTMSSLADMEKLGLASEDKIIDGGIAKETLTKYNVTYVFAGTKPASATVPTEPDHKAGEEVTVAAKPTDVPGYTVTEWSTSDASISNGKFTMPAKNVTLTSTWTPNTYTVTYDKNTPSGTTVTGTTADSTHTYGTSSKLTKNGYTASGYTFGGWATSKGGAKAYDDEQSVLNLTTTKSGTVTLYAIWTAASDHSVTYQYTGTTPTGAPTLPATATPTFNTSVNVAAAPTLTGYTFSGWSSTDVTISNGKFTMPAKNVVIKGEWTANTYTVTYDKNTPAGTTVSGTTADSSHTYDVAKKLTKNGYTAPGYTFGGWATTKGGGSAYSDEQSVTNLTTTKNGTVTLYAVWTVSSANSVTYQFTGTVPTGAASLLPGVTNPAFNTEVTVAAAPTLAGYTFSGWSSTDVTISNGKFTMPAKNVTITGSWSANTYTVKYDKNAPAGTTVSGSTDDSIHTFDVAKKLTKNGYTLTGYNFDGWATTTTGARVYADEASVTNLSNEAGGVKTLYARWVKKNDSGVTYQYSGTAPASAPAVPTVTPNPEFGDTVTVATAPTLTGYTFSGWSSTDIDVSSGSFNMPAKPVTITGSWTANTYTVHYDGNKPADAPAGTVLAGTTGDSTHTYDVAKTLTKNGFTLTGYTFAGWSTSTTGTVAHSDEESVTNLTTVKNGTVNLYAIWTKKADSGVTYQYTGVVPSGAPAVPTVSPNPAYGDVVTVAAAPTLTGYTFSGWATTDATIASGTFNMPAQAVTLTGSWTANTYTVKYDGNKPASAPAGTVLAGTTGDSTHTYDVDKALTTNGYTLTGYTFGGWAETAGGTKKYDDAAVLKNLSSTPNGVVTLYAVWTPKNDSGIVYSYSGTVPDGAPAVPVVATNPAYGDTVNVATAPTLAGYTFSGWTTNDATITGGQFRMPNKGVNITGSWTAHGYTVHYNANKPGDAPATATLTGSMTNSAHVYDVDKALNTNGFTLKGYTFQGWAKTQAGGVTYSDGETVKNLTTTDGEVVELYAVWSKKADSGVTYKYTGTVPTGAPAVPTVTPNPAFGDTVTVAAAPTLTGYTFSGWTTSDADASSGSFSMPDTGVEFTGSWKTNEYTVKYDANKPSDAPATATLSGSTADSAHVYDIEKPLNTNGYTLKGYTFDGWAMTSAGAVAKNDGETVKNLSSTDGAVVTLYAKWTKKSDSGVTYKYTGTVPSAAPAVPTVTPNPAFGDTVTVAADATLTGYTFSGWKTSDVDASSGSFSMPDTGVEFSGSWTTNKYKVHYNSNKPTAAPATSVLTGDTPDSSHVYDIDSALTTNGFALKGYSFSGWSKTPGGTAEYSDAQVLKNLSAIDNDTVELYAVWTKRTDSGVSYEYIGTAPAAAPAIPTVSPNPSYGDIVTVANNPTLTGYTFSGWKTSDVDVSGGQFTMPDYGVKFTGTWKVNTYTVLYDGNRPSSAPTTSVIEGNTPDSAFTYDVAKELNPNGYTLTGYTFKGWSKTPGGTVEYTDKQSITNMTATDGEVITLYAVWDINKHTVTYEYGNAPADIPSDAPALPAVATHNYGETVTVAPLPTSTENNFTGWTLKSGDASAEDVENGSFTMKDTDIVLTGSWSVKTFIVTFQDASDADEDYQDAILKTQTVEYGNPATAPSEPDNKTGYHFKNWDKPFTNVTTDTIVKAVYEANTYTVTYDINAANAVGTVPADQNFTYDEEKQVPPSTLTRPGYFFSGWATKPNSLTVEYTNGATLKNMTTEDGGTVTLYAVWGACTPVTDDPPIEKKLTVIYDEPDNPYKFQFQMKPISTDADGLTVASMPMPGAAPGTTKVMGVYGPGAVEFGIITFTVPGTYVYELSELPGTDTHYTFDTNVITVTYVITQVGTTLNSDRTMEYADHSNADPAIFTNTYTAKHFTVTFDCLGGLPMAATQRVEEGVAAIQPINPFRSGYYFLWWYDSNDITKSPYDWSTPITKDIHLVAFMEWVPDSTETPAPVGGGKPGLVRSAKTGDPAPILSLICLVTVSAGILVIMMKKRNTKKSKHEKA